MHDQIAVQMMRRCLETIESQRAQIAHLAPKAEAYDRLGALIDMQAGNRNRAFGDGPDVAWNLRAEIELATRRMSDEKSQTTTRADRPADYRDPDEQENGGRIDPALHEETLLRRAEDEDDRAASEACRAEAVQREIVRRQTTTQTLHDE
jgi:hypothetical protein